MTTELDDLVKALGQLKFEINEVRNTGPMTAAERKEVNSDLREQKRELVSKIRAIAPKFKVSEIAPIHPFLSSKPMYTVDSKSKENGDSMVASGQGTPGKEGVLKAHGTSQERVETLLDNYENAFIVVKQDVEQGRFGTTPEAKAMMKRAAYGEKRLEKISKDAVGAVQKIVGDKGTAFDFDGKVWVVNDPTVMKKVTNSYGKNHGDSTARLIALSNNFNSKSKLRGTIRQFRLTDYLQK